jgi:flagellar biogenesis protein FliO
MLAALGLVLGLFLATIWLLRRSLPAGARMLPSEVVEVLGRAPLGGRQHAQLVRCGNKLLLLSVAPAGVETLTEITDPLEVDRLAGLCQQSHPQSASTAFRQVFQQFGQKPAKGFLERRSNDLQLASDGFDDGSNDAEADRG